MIDARENSEFYPVALTIAGSDSGGGAGVQADLRAFSAFGVFGVSAVTAVTAQNPREVRGVESISPEFVSAQIAAVRAEFAVRCVKTGMLGSAGTVAAVAEALRGVRAPLVVDPVMISGSGTPLLDSDAAAVLKEELLPLADWITPNIPEAEALLGRSIGSIEEMESAAAEIAGVWRAGCVLKGGHLDGFGGEAVDVVVRKGETRLLVSPRLDFPAEIADVVTHGTGCTFSAAMAAGTAIELPWKDMLIAAKAFVHGSLAESVKAGRNLACMYPPAGSHRDKVRLMKVRRGR